MELNTVVFPDPAKPTSPIFMARSRSIFHTQKPHAVPSGVGSVAGNGLPGVESFPGHDLRGNRNEGANLTALEGIWNRRASVSVNLVTLMVPPRGKR
jgi:hypothetical protein